MKNKKMIKTYSFLLLLIISYSSLNLRANTSNLDRNTIETIQNIENENNKKYNNSYLEDEDGYIYLDKILETEEEIKEEKLTKFDKFINKIDEKVNPTLTFRPSSAYGNWYLIKSSNIEDTKYKNIRYDFKQEQSGYRIEKNYYDKELNRWTIVNTRAWIEEKKGKVFLGTEKKYMFSYSNPILYFDKNYKYMIIKFVDDNSIRVFSRTPEDIILDGEEREKIEKVLLENIALNNIEYDVSVDNSEEEKIRKKQIIEEKAAEMERKIKENPEDVFRISKDKYDR